MGVKKTKDQVAGSMKEQTGKVTGNDTLEAKGKAQKARGKAKAKVDQLKDKGARKFNKAIDAVTDDE